jgi:outer membrane biosynthesis protein TonB
MRSVARGVLIFLLLASFVTGYTGPGLAKDHKFIPPDVTSASDIPYPINAMVYGIVTLTVNLNESGRIQKTQVLRDIPPLTEAVTAAMNDWMFRPGMLDGVAVPANVNVSVVFNPGNVAGQRLQLPAVNMAPPPKPDGYLPPEIAAAMYAAYPMESVETGSVVLDVLVDKSNDVKKVTPLQGVPSLTSQATAAVRGWTINSATFNGKRIPSDVVIAFVFRSPSIGAP